MLYDGVVTGKFVLSGKGVPMYLYKGVKVSGSHCVYTDEGLKKISDLEEPILLTDYSEEFIYCLTTEAKQISIMNLIFADYDDLTKEDCKILISWVENRFLEKPRALTNYAIHRYLNGGLSDTNIMLSNGNKKMLSKIDIGDRLKGNITVTGKVDVLSDVNIKCVNIQGNELIGGPNIQIMDKGTGCSLNVMDSVSISTTTNEPLYHLLTDKGGFYVNNLYIGDYSVGMNLLFKEEIQEVLKRI